MFSSTTVRPACRWASTNLILSRRLFVRGIRRPASPSVGELLLLVFIGRYRLTSPLFSFVRLAAVKIALLRISRDLVQKGKPPVQARGIRDMLNAVTDKLNQHGNRWDIEVGVVAVAGVKVGIGLCRLDRSRL